MVQEIFGNIFINCFCSLYIDLKACLIELLFNREEYPKNLIEKLLKNWAKQNVK